MPWTITLLLRKLIGSLWDAAAPTKCWPGEGVGGCTQWVYTKTPGVLCIYSPPGVCRTEKNEGRQAMSNGFHAVNGGSNPPGDAKANQALTWKCKCFLVLRKICWLECWSVWAFSSSFGAAFAQTSPSLRECLFCGWDTVPLFLRVFCRFRTYDPRHRLRRSSVRHWII